MKIISFFTILVLSTALPAQQTGAENAPPQCLSAEEDQQKMKELLGITEMRYGRSPNQDSPNAANYDESLASPFDRLPDPLVMDNGKAVKSAESWYRNRRPEIAEHFSREVYGRIPEAVPEVTWEVLISEREFIGWTPVVAKKLVGRVDNSSYPYIDVNIEMVVVTPERASGPVPLLMMFGQARLPAPAQPSPGDFEVINQAMRDLLSRDSAMKEVLDKYPAYDPLTRPEGVNHWGFFSGTDHVDSRAKDLIEAGWGYAMINPSSIQADNGEGLSCGGIIALVNKGQPRKADDWGALRAWSWGAARGLDYLEQDPAVDKSRVGIEGVSRYGKAALVTLAFEERFAFGLIGSSGKGGVTLHRRNFGESVENLAGGGAYHWMAGNYMKYAAENGASGRMDASDLPVDAHHLLALCAPRLVYISYGIPEKGDALWLDQQGSFMAAVAAQPVFRLLGAKDMGVPDDYMHAEMPPVLEGLLDGQLAWRQHDGGHTDAPNMNSFITWIGKMLPAGQ